jgi:hypothetical protein
MATWSNALRIASTAAPSASFFWPRPIQRAAEIAAASVTRTSSNARLRSVISPSCFGSVALLVSDMRDIPSVGPFGRARGGGGGAQAGSMRIIVGGSMTASSAAMRSSAARIAVSSVSCVTSTTGTASPGLRARCSMDSSDTP